MVRLVKIIVVILVVLVLGYYAYMRLMPHPAGGPPGGAPPVSIAEVIQRNVRQWSEFSGRLTAIDQVDIRPQVSGVIEKIYFSDGAMVHKGDMLVTIDPRPYEAALKSAAAREVLAESELRRARELLAAHAIAQHDFDQRQSDAEVARADVATARLNLEYTHIRSPISGRVGRAEVTAGNLVESGGSAPVLTTVVTISPIYADFDVDEDTFIRYVQAGVSGNTGASQIPVMMGLSGENGAPHMGHIESFDNRLSSSSGTIRVRAIFDNADGLLVPGLFARIRLGSPQEAPTILITDRAVGTDQSKKFVYVVGSDNKAQYREVTLGGTVGGLRIVQSGLKQGERIIVDGVQRAHPGAPVTPQLVPMEETASKDAAAAAKDKEQTPKDKEDKSAAP